MRWADNSVLTAYIYLIADSLLPSINNLDNTSFMAI